MPPEVGGEPLLSLTRAWTLVRFFQSDMLTVAPCSCCKGKYVVNSFDLNRDYQCGLCHMPSRAGKTRKSKEAALLNAA
jgi:flagellar transcriptional activator FlhC